MSEFLEALNQRPLLFDGAMGTLLYDRGVFLNRSYEELNLSQPQKVAKAHGDYVMAGADVIETNTFGANPIALQRHGHEASAKEINEAGVSLARSVAGKNVFVAGAVGPTGLNAMIATAQERLLIQDAYRKQMGWLVDAKVDLLLLETFSSIVELELALEVAKELTTPVVAQLVFTKGEAEGGLLPEDVAARLVASGADVVGANCGSGPAELYSVAKSMVGKGAPVSIQPNAGLPNYVDGRTIYVSNPENFGVFARRLLKLGVKMVGGCCGTSPRHIQAMNGAIRMMSSRRRNTGNHWVAATPLKPVALAERSELGKRLAEGQFVSSVELTSPRGTGLEKFNSKLEQVASSVINACNIADGPRATARVSNVAACALALAAGIEPILHICCRDKNYLGLVSHLLGAHALGIRNLVIISGDPPKMGDYPFATPVYDVDSVGLLKIANAMNHGLDPAGKELPSGPTKFLLATGAEPAAVNYEEELRRLELKKAAGAELVMTQPVYDPGLLQKFLKDIEPLNIPVMVGLLPLASHKNALFLHNEVPGMQIPQTYRDIMKKAGDGPTAQAAGIEIAREVLASVQEQVAGAYVMPPFNRVQAAVDTLSPVTDLLR